MSKAVYSSAIKDSEAVVNSRRTNIINSLPITQRMVRLRKQDELMRLLVNHYIFNNVMKKRLEDELMEFLEYTEELYNKPNTILDIMKEERLLDSLPYLLTVIRYEINCMKVKVATHK